MVARRPSDGSAVGDDRYALDGNALAGLLEELFEAEMTSAMRVCQSCGRRNAIGAHRAYVGAGIVLRCPACRDLAMVISLHGDRRRVWLAGEWTLQAPVRR